ncbi:hypothetical protein GCM10022237_20430 [Nocardioides ginsengisoli]|uniref:WD40 repeat domain-containing protein n=1 Tax=Nocardioides ginsengisoli TaxID=363868 RepID=A0ABW3W5T9_9ACTN
MPEHLAHLLHASVDDLAVPHPDAHAIAARGRSMRTRRRVGAALVAAAAVAAIGVGAAVVHDIAGDRRSDSDRIAQQPHPGRAYDARGAWIAGDRITVGDATVRLPGAISLAQTSVGVVAQVTRPKGASSWILIDPTGAQTRLSIPSTVNHVEGDPSQPRVAWLEPGDDELTAHIWDVAADREVDATGQPSSGTRAGEVGPVVRAPILDGDDVYWTDDEGVSRHIVWRGRPEIRADRYSYASVRSGIATVRDGERWLVWDMAGERVVRRLDAGIGDADVSPDGRHLLLRIDSGATPSVVVEPTGGGAAVRLPGLTGISAWTRDGHVVGQVAGEPTVRTCAVDGSCVDRPADGLDAAAPLVLVADYLMVG